MQFCKLSSVSHWKRPSSKYLRPLLSIVAKATSIFEQSDSLLLYLLCYLEWPFRFYSCLNNECKWMRHHVTLYSLVWFFFFNLERKYISLWFWVKWKDFKYAARITRGFDNVTKPKRKPSFQLCHLAFSCSVNCWDTYLPWGWETSFVYQRGTTLAKFISFCNFLIGVSPEGILKEGFYCFDTSVHQPTVFEIIGKRIYISTI